MDEQKELQLEPYPAFVTLVFWRLKFSIKRFILRYVMRYDIYAEHNVRLFTKKEHEWLLCKNTWTLRLLIFFTDQSTMEVALREQWKNTTPIPSSNVAPSDSTSPSSIVEGSPEEVQPESPNTNRKSVLRAAADNLRRRTRMTSRDRSLSSVQRQKSIGELLADNNIEGLKNMNRGDFEMLMKIATKPEVYPMFMDVLENNMFTNMIQKCESSLRSWITMD